MGARGWWIRRSSAPGIPRSLVVVLGSRPLRWREGGLLVAPRPPLWIPACAGMTDGVAGMADGGRGNDGRLSGDEGVDDCMNGFRCCV